MKYTTLSSIGLGLLVIVCCGCATKSHFETIYGSWVGQPYKSFEAAYGLPHSVGKEGKNVIYKYQIEGMKDCTIYWTVNDEGMIIKWRHEGNGCVKAPFG